VPSLPTLICLFLYDQIHANDHHSSVDVLLHDCPSYMGAIKVFNLAAVTFIAPSDPSGITGMRHEHIHAVPSWCNRPGHFDCAFVNRQQAGRNTKHGCCLNFLLFFLSLSLIVASIHAHSFSGSIGSLKNETKLQECTWLHHLLMRTALPTYQ
jgi:hypothetical protein